MEANFEKSVDLIAGVLQRAELEPIVLVAQSGFVPGQHKRLLSFDWSCVYASEEYDEITESITTNRRECLNITDPADSGKIRLDRMTVPIVRIIGEGFTPGTPETRKQYLSTEALLVPLEKLLAGYGKLIVVGYRHNPALDELIGKLIVKIGRKSSAFFVGNESFPDGYLNDCAHAGQVVCLPFSIDEILDEITDNEQNDAEGTNYADYKKAPHIYINQKFLKLDSLRDETCLRNISPFAQLLDYYHVELENHVDTRDREELRARFTEFLKSSAFGTPQWYGFREDSKFHLKRYFEEDLYQHSTRLLAGIDKYDDIKPIIVCGQACSGKTNALCDLAYRVFGEKRYPVVYISSAADYFLTKQEGADALHSGNETVI